MPKQRRKQEAIVIAVTFISSVVCAAVWAQYGTSYQAGNPPSVGEISHVVPLAPPPTTRTNVGVMEVAELTISSRASAH